MHRCFLLLALIASVISSTHSIKCCADTQNISERLDYSYVLNDPTQRIEYSHNTQSRAEIIDNMGRKSSSSYDSYGNVTSQTQYLELGDGTPRVITTSTQYGDSCNPELETKTTDALGRVTTMTYDVWGNMVTVTPPVGYGIETARTYSKDAIPSVVETWTRNYVNGAWVRVKCQRRSKIPQIAG